MNRQHREAAFGYPTPSPPETTLPGSPAAAPDVALGREVAQKIVRPANAETTVLTLAHPCTAVDVYIDMRNVPLAAGGLFVVRVYAWLGQVRALVGTGRLNNTTIARPFDQARLVASARAPGDRFDVTLSRDRVAIGDVTAVQDVEFPISAVGYQAAASETARPLHVNTVWSASVAAALFQHLGAGEVLSANGTNAEAAGTASRFIQIWDTATGVGGTGVLLDEIVIAPQQPWSIAYGDNPLVFQDGLVFAMSTTSGQAGFVAVAIPNGVISYEVR